MDYKHWLLDKYRGWRHLLPERLLYHGDFSRIAALLDAPAEVVADAARARLRQVLADAVRFVPFYRQHVRLPAGAIAHEDIMAVLAGFPYVDKHTVMERQRDFLDERRNPRWLVYATSTGSSGRGIGVWRSKRAADAEKAFYGHEWGRHGFSLSRSRHLRIGADATRGPGEPPLWVAGNRLMLSPYHLQQRHRRTILDALNRFQPEYVHAYPSCAATLACLLHAGELDFAVRAVLLASEALLPQQAAAISAVFRCPISVSYGQTERTNLAFAAWRDGHVGPYRFEPLYGVSENLTVNGRHEIVGTGLWNDAMPLIRYRTGDIGLIAPDGLCAAIEGRSQEVIVDRFGHHIPGLTIMVDNAAWQAVRVFQIRQERPGSITIAVVPRAARLTSEQQRQLLDAQRRQWGAVLDISIAEVPDILPGPGGKHAFVVTGGAAGAAQAPSQA